MSVDNIALANAHQQLAYGNGEGAATPAAAAQPRRYSRGAKLPQSSREELLNNFRRFSKARNENDEGTSGGSKETPPLAGDPATGQPSTASNFATAEFGMCLSEILKLSGYQTMIIQQTWPKIKSTVFNNVLRQLSKRNATARELFQKMTIVEGFSSTTKCFDQREHHRMLINLFDTCVHELNAPANNILEKCARFGKEHYTLCGGGGASKLWDDMGDCLTEALAKADGVRGKRETFRAWILLIAFLIDSIKADYMSLCKRKSVLLLPNSQITGL